MAQQLALTPKLDSLTVTPVDLNFPLTIKAFLSHPFTPWGPIPLFYVRFIVNRVRQLVFTVNGHSESSSFELEPVSMGVVLARERETNLCIWSGQIIDGLVNMGIEAEMAKSVAKSVHDWIVDRERGWRYLKHGVDVEMRVVTTTVLVSSAMNVASSSSSNGTCGQS